MNSTPNVNGDIFAHILFWISNAKVIQTLLRAIPMHHPFFDQALSRLLQLPIYISSEKELNSISHTLLTGLLFEDEAQPPLRLVERTRHLVVSADIRNRFHASFLTNAFALKTLFPSLFLRSNNLRVLDWRSMPGPSQEELAILRNLERLETLRIDCRAPRTDIFSAESEEYWNINVAPLVMAVGSKLRSLELRGIGQSLFRTLETQSEEFTSFTSLEHLHVDLTHGTWDWEGTGSPPHGASDAYPFRNLGFPALTKVELRVSDLTIKADKCGPLEFFTWETLEEFTIVVVDCFSWVTLRNVRLFNSLPAEKFAALRKLEIKDEGGFEWAAAEDEARSVMSLGRCYVGFVPNFLASVRSGLLQNLTTLWVDHELLCFYPRNAIASTSWAGYDMNFYTVRQLWEGGSKLEDSEWQRKAEWISVLKSVFQQLESLRVGFGAMDAYETVLILSCCSVSKLKQFGFHYDWRSSDRFEASIWKPIFRSQVDQYYNPISHSLLRSIAKFHKLTDVHILQPRPRTRDFSRISERDSRLINDITLLFRCNPSLCRVGVGRNAVWERRCGPSFLSESDSVSESSGPSNSRMTYQLMQREDVPKFYDAGAVDGGAGKSQFEGHNDHRAEDMEELSGLLERITANAHGRWSSSVAV